MIKLEKPTLKELSYRQELLADKDTMEYNAGYDLPMDNYDYKTGCFDFTEKRWIDWYDRVVNNPKNFYAYVLCNSKPVGEVFLAEDGEISIIIQAKYRSKGYAKQALKLLIDKAFNSYKKQTLVNNIPEDRKNSVNLFKNLGFNVESSYNILRFNKEQKILLIKLKR